MAGLGCLLICLTLVWLFWGAGARAADGIAVTIPVHQTFGVTYGDSTVNREGTYELSAVATDAPLPEGSRNGKYLFFIDGEDQEASISLYFTETGYREYQLRQVTADAEGYSYDPTVYTIRVSITRQPDGTLTSAIVGVKPSGEKTEEILFANSYTGTPPETETETESETETEAETETETEIETETETETETGKQTETNRQTETDPTNKNSSGTTTTTAASGSGTVKTGDTANALLWAALLLAAAVLLALTAAHKKTQ